MRARTPQGRTKVGAFPRKPGPMPASPKPTYSPAQVAAWAAVSSMTVIRWCEAGVLPFEPTRGGHRRISQDVVRAFLQDRGIPLPDELAEGKRAEPSRVVTLVAPARVSTVRRALHGLGTVAPQRDAHAAIVAIVSTAAEAVIVDATLVDDLPRWLAALERASNAEATTLFVVGGAGAVAFDETDRVRRYPPRGLADALFDCRAHLEAVARRGRRRSTPPRRRAA